jgi:glucosyl-3-phosphoglycerate synthase
MITTLHSNDILSASGLTSLKKKKNQTISVVIPARNEAATIGPIVKTIRELMRTTGLVDEVVVMDDDSEDATVETARNEGASVYQVATVESSVTPRGKGVALWKSLFVTTGSLLVFIDADLCNFNERFITGLCSALLCNDTLHLAKASYHRPLLTENGQLEDSGGRVTELMVRPLLDMFLPDLAQVHQPLAGEYALRRSSLETIQFYSGYGVEIGLILEYYFTMGIKSIGQVELEKRIHRNRPLNELSIMASEIALVVFSYLEEQGYCTLTPSGGTIRNDAVRNIPEDVRLPPVAVIQTR